QPLLARTRRQACMQCPSVWSQRAVDIVEVQCAAGWATELLVQKTELGLGAPEVFVQIDEKCRDALPEFLQFGHVSRQRRIEKIVVPAELLPGRIMQHVGLFERLRLKSRGLGN